MLRVNVIFIDKEGKNHPVKGKIGDRLLYLAHRHNIEMEGIQCVFGINV